MTSHADQFNIHTLGQQLHTFFAPTVETVARQTQFVRRQSPLTGLKFLQVLVFGFLERPRATLVDLAQACHDVGVTISPQGFDERLTAKSVAFLKAMFEQACRVFQNQQAFPVALVQQFTGIYIVDSTILSLPPPMHTEYPSCGGNGSPASLKIQLVFEFLRGNFSQVTLQAGRAADQAYREYLAVITAGALFIADLGYFSLNALQLAVQQRAFFLLRYYPRTAVLTPEAVALDLPTWLRTETAAQCERAIGLGATHHLACRLIAVRLPEAVAEERRRKARAKARREGRGRTLSAEYTYLLGWNLFVTNVPAARLT